VGDPITDVADAREVRRDTRDRAEARRLRHRVEGDDDVVEEERLRRGAADAGGASGAVEADPNWSSVQYEVSGGAALSVEGPMETGAFEPSWTVSVPWAPVPSRAIVIVTWRTTLSSSCASAAVPLTSDAEPLAVVVLKMLMLRKMSYVLPPFAPVSSRPVKPRLLAVELYSPKRKMRSPLVGDAGDEMRTSKLTVIESPTPSVCAVNARDA
jgi:hypothetical protein